MSGGGGECGKRKCPMRKKEGAIIFLMGRLNGRHCNLFLFWSDDKWKVLRSSMTPIFTGGKIKQLKEIVREFGDDYAQTLLDTIPKDGKTEKFCMRE